MDIVFITTSCCPSQWKVATVLPVGLIFDPLASSQCFLKFLGCLWLKKINEFVKRHNLISPLESSFRKNHSFCTAVLRTTDDILSNMDYIQLTLICFLNVVNHDSAHKNDAMFNNVTQYVFGLSKYEHISSWRKQLLILAISNYHDTRNCIFLYKLNMTQTPSYVYSKLSARVGDIIIHFY